MGENLSELLERVQMATGPIPEVDAAMMALVYVRGERHIGTSEDSGPHGKWVPVKSHVWIDPTTDKWVSTHPREFTASVDAITALVKRILPGWQWGIWANRCQGPLAHVEDNELDSSSQQRFEAHASTPALALCAALLKALISRSTSLKDIPDA